MPNYEYQCTSCQHVFEVWQNVGEAAPPCPECGSEVKKVFHPPRVIFKGSGFYVTDLRAEQSQKSASKPSVVAGENSASGESATTDKPADKPSEKTETKSDAPSSAPNPTSSSPSSTSAASAKDAK